MLNTIVAHDTNSRHFDFSDLTSDERAELNAWIDATTPEITDAELNEMYRRDQEYQHSLYELAKVRQNNVDRLKAYLLACMKQAGINKVENGVHKIRVAKSPHTVQVLDEARVPAEFRKVIIERTIDKSRFIRIGIHGFLGVLMELEPKKTGKGNHRTPERDG